MENIYSLVEKLKGSLPFSGIHDFFNNFRQLFFNLKLYSHGACLRAGLFYNFLLKTIKLA